jgi:acetolactate synthase small subunit
MLQSSQALHGATVDAEDDDVIVEVDGIAARYQVFVDVLVEIEVELGNVIALVLVLVDLDAIIDQLVEVEKP